MPSKAPWLRRTILFISGQTVSLFGSALVQFAISWHITLTTKSGFMLTMATLCGFLPQLLISLVGGVWADRFDRKKLIILVDAGIAVSTAVLAVLFMMGYTDVWLLFVISAIRSLGAGVQQPAVGAYLPELVPQEELVRVNGIQASISGITMLAAPALAGVLYAAVGIGATFWVDVVTAAIAIGLLLTFKVAPRVREAHEEQHFIDDMLGGVRYVAGEKWLKQILVFNLAFMLLLGPMIFLTPLMVARSFGEEPWRLAAHEMVFSVGTIVGGAMAGILGVKFRNKMNMVIMANAAFSVLTFIMGFSPNFWFYLSVMLIMGVSLPFLNTGSMTVMQTRVRPDVMGRVMGLFSIIGSSALPLSMLIFGPLADVMSVETQLIITGAIMMALSLVLPRLKALHAAGEPLPKADDSDPEGGEASHEGI